MGDLRGSKDGGTSDKKKKTIGKKEKEKQLFKV